MDEYEANDRCFLKILLEDDDRWKEQLRIPPEFRRHLSEEAKGEVILKCNGSKTWEVSLRRKGKEIYLRDGWKKFCEDNRLGNTKFLIFWYDERKSFKVQIFGQTGARGSITLPTCPSKLLQLLVLRSVKGMRSSARIGILVSVSNLSYCFQGLEQGKREQRKTMKEVKEEETGNETGASVPEHSAKEKSTFEDPAWRYRSVEEATRINEIIDSFRSKVPFFACCLRNSEVERMLTFLKNFAVAHLPREKTDIVLLNPCGKHYKVTYICSNGQYWFKEGWPAFVADNALKVGDICLFEREDRTFYKVHIYPR